MPEDTLQGRHVLRLGAPPWMSAEAAELERAIRQRLSDAFEAEFIALVTTGRGFGVTVDDIVADPSDA